MLGLFNIANFMTFVNIQEKQILVDNVNINYKIIGDGNIPIILLHGWGVDSDKYISTAKYLSQMANRKWQIVIPDLPGFGKSDNPQSDWGVDEYTEFVEKFLQCINSKGSPWIIIGHSFGGRIAIKFAAKYSEKINTLILTGAAGIKHKPNLKQKIFYLFAKIGKIIFSLPLMKRLEKSAQKLLYRAACENDYYSAKGVMKDSFKKVIHEDLIDCLEEIKTPTLLVWGRNDHSTPLEDAYIMKEKIVNSQLEIIDGANHSLPYQFPEKFAKIIIKFIDSDR